MRGCRDINAVNVSLKAALYTCWPWTLGQISYLVFGDFFIGTFNDLWLKMISLSEPNGVCCQSFLFLVILAVDSGRAPLSLSLSLFGLLN